MLPYTPYLTTLERVKQLRRQTITEDNDDALLTSFIEGVSAGIARATNRVFVPYRATYYYDAIGTHLGSAAGVADILYLDEDDLLEILTLTNGDATTVSSTAYVLRPANAYPKDEIVIKSSSGVSFTYTDDWEQAISVLGWWGCVPHYAAAWKSVTTLNGAINASVTSAVLTSAASAEVGQYLKLDTEIMRVTAISTNTVTVVRGELGTTAAAHDSAVTVSAYQHIGDIQHAATELVSYVYKNKDNLGGRVQIYEGGILQVSDVDPTVKDTIRRYTRNVFTAV